ncbi:GNAT family N-acetyltransferase [Streptomyces sp. JJ66]|uniref:GNAT family N-acetyltransferase n=1 Tax=Streptomyces sp. JJ66 TaxID=2803843 RepID=UPI001C5A42D8|nr:GNAT family N-acetyltransferase [Streptomyces sp. JJ66]MBW1601600.1 GNAT family N-acetyltransferase [Streptomyces sp. JJ66]
MPEITQLSAADLLRAADALAELLLDVVDGGDSLGFLSPLTHAEARAWWTSRADALEVGHALLWAAHTGGQLTGTVTLLPAPMPNGRHRADVAKLMVHRAARGRGVARALLDAAERAAADAGLTLLVLDTQSDTAAVDFYRATGWTEAGTIPGYATDTTGTPRPTTYFYKQLAA